MNLLKSQLMLLSIVCQGIENKGINYTALDFLHVDLSLNSAGCHHQAQDMRRVIWFLLFCTVIFLDKIKMRFYLTGIYTSHIVTRAYACFLNYTHCKYIYPWHHTTLFINALSFSLKYIQGCKRKTHLSSQAQLIPVQILSASSSRYLP